MIARLSGFLAWVALAALATRITPASIGGPLFAVACTASLAHLLDLYRHVTDALDVPSDDDDDASAGGDA